MFNMLEVIFFIIFSLLLLKNKKIHAQNINPNSDMDSCCMKYVSRKTAKNGSWH